MRDRLVTYALFFGSGLASLTCEVVWFKQLGFVLGSSTFSASVVVACFFGGLSIGSLALGWVADRVRRPLVAYAIAEGSLAAVSLGTTALLSAWDRWIGLFTPWMSLDADGSRPLKVALATAILLPPTVLMGGTLPILARWLVRTRDDLGASIGSLYATNTLGAAIGCALVGWVWIGWLGVSGSAALASAIYAGIAVVALGLARRSPVAPGAIAPEAVPVGAPAPGPLPALLIALFGVSG
ncbi:MAG: fused MFS/spermidine synthase, partial [Myxococcota bacterium]